MLLSFLFRIAELSTIAFVTRFFPIHPVASVTAAIATSFMIYVGLNLILSMKQLTVTIETITFQIQKKEMKSKNRWTKIIVFSWGIVYTVLQCLAVYYGVVIGEELFYTAILYTVLMLLMCLFLLLVLFLLLAVMFLL